jgi:hypothetical protein
MSSFSGRSGVAPAQQQQQRRQRQQVQQQEQQVQSAAEQLEQLEQQQKEQQRQARATVEEELRSLTPDQRNVVMTATTTKQQHTAVLAPPGSGKTRTLVARILWLLYHENEEDADTAPRDKKRKQDNHNLHARVRPEDVLLVTYGKKAAKEMSERLHRLLPPAAQQQQQPAWPRSSSPASVFQPGICG